MARLFRVGNQPAILLQAIPVFEHCIQRHKLAPQPNITLVSGQPRRNECVGNRDPIR